ncbi:hypothetical protein EV424DRAFT_1558524 [Suillus variegatus]|nr:hypothetical protein EV424DRAFT_1558524 [Suillus variegatus]
MPSPSAPDPLPPPEVPPPPPDEPGSPYPSWRTLRNTSRFRKPRPDQPPPPEPHLIVPDEGSPGLFGPRTPRPPELDPAPTGEPVHSWVTWHPNPALAPTPPPIKPRLILSDNGSPGLFGPRTPRPPELDPAPTGEPVHSWVTWHPNPARAPTYAAVD